MTGALIAAGIILALFGVALLSLPYYAHLRWVQVPGLFRKFVARLDALHPEAVPHELRRKEHLGEKRWEVEPSPEEMKTCLQSEKIASLGGVGREREELMRRLTRLERLEKFLGAIPHLLLHFPESLMAFVLLVMIAIRFKATFAERLDALVAQASPAGRIPAAVVGRIAEQGPFPFGWMNEYPTLTCALAFFTFFLGAQLARARSPLRKRMAARKGRRT